MTVSYLPQFRNIRPSRVAGALVLTLCVTGSQAFAVDLVSTDRLGMSGTIARYLSLSDALQRTGAAETVSARESTLSLLFSGGGTQGDRNIISATQSVISDMSGLSSFGSNMPAAPSALLSMFDDDGSTDLEKQMSFGSYDGTQFTEFSFMASGSNATTDEDNAMLSLGTGSEQAGSWLNWSVEFTASGLQGVEIEPGVIEALDAPSALSGSLRGIFEMLPTEDGGQSTFYAVDFDLGLLDVSQDSDARASASPIDYYDESDRFRGNVFRTAGPVIPMPTPLAIAFTGLMGVASIRRRR